MSDEEKALSLSDLADEYGHWNKLPGMESDSYGAFAQLAELYKYAISNYNEPGIGLLLEAISEARMAG